MQSYNHNFPLQPEADLPQDPFAPHQRDASWAYLTWRSRRLFEDWASARLSQYGYHDFKLSWLPILMGARPEGVTNQDLANRNFLAKQAMSKTIKDLEEAGYVYTEKNLRDGRSQLLFLTEKGKQLRLSAIRHQTWMRREMEELVGGPKEFKSLLDNFNKIIRWQEFTAPAVNPEI